jgi:hypothetical protein
VRVQRAEVGVGVLTVVVASPHGTHRAQLVVALVDADELAVDEAAHPQPGVPQLDSAEIAWRRGGIGGVGKPPVAVR